jgi:hypothetical protein
MEGLLMPANCPPNMGLYQMMSQKQVFTGSMEQRRRGCMDTHGLGARERTEDLVWKRSLRSSHLL